MATDVERLTVSLEANVKKFENELNRARGVAVRSMKDVERQSSGLERAISRSFGRIGGIVAGAFGGAQAASAVASAATQYVNLQNTLKVAGLEGRALESTFAGLFQIAQKNGTAIAPLVTLYSRATQAQKELGASSAELMTFTEGISIALRVAGSSSTEASGALLQLSQALGSGTVRAEEFNSVNEGARPILQAVAAGMKEAGGSVATLKTLVNDGKVSSQAFFRAFLAGMPQLAEQAAKAEGTVSQATDRTKNAFVILVGELDKTVGASANASTALNGVAGAIEGMPTYIASATAGLAQLQAWLNTVGNNPIWRRLGELTGGDFSAEGLRKAGVTPMGGGLGNRIGDVFDSAGTGSQGSMFGQIGPQLPKAKVTPISLADYAAPGAKKSGTAGGGASDEEKRTDQVARYVAQLEKSGRVLQAEFDTLGKSNAERAKAVELARIGTITDEKQLARLDAAVTTNEQLRTEIEKVESAQRAAAEAMSDFGTALSDAFKGAVLEGEKLDDVARRLLDRLASRAIDGAFDSLFSAKPGGTSPVAGALSSLFGGARASGGPVQAGKTYLVGENGPEMVRFGRNGSVIPNAAMARSSSAGGGVTIAPSYQIDARGSSMSEAQFRAILADNNRALVAKLPALVGDARGRNHRM